MRDDDDTLGQLRAALLAAPAEVSTSAVGRLWRTGRTALGLARARDKADDEIDPAAMAAAVARLGQLRGLAMKAGQMLAYVDTAMPASIRTMLAALQTSAPTMAWPEVEAIVRAALGDVAEIVLRGLEHTPVAAASIAQVHHGVFVDGSELAVKIRQRGIAEALAADFRSADIGRMFATMAGMGAVTGFIDEARTAFLEECDFGLEARRQQRFADIFADDPDLVVPAVEHGLCGDGVLTTRWVPGRSLDRFLADDPSPAERARVARALWRFWMRTLYRDGLFHGDPHPGNFAFVPDGRIVVYDYGCVRSFAPDVRLAFADLANATAGDDLDGMAAGIEALGGIAPRSAAQRDHLRRLLRGFFGPLLRPGDHAIAGDEGVGARSMLADKRLLASLRLPGRMLFLFRLRFGLYAVLARIGGAVDFGALERAWAHGDDVPARYDASASAPASNA